MKKKEKRMQIYFWGANVDLYHDSQLAFYWYLKFYDCEGLYSFDDIDNDQNKYYTLVNLFLSNRCGSFTALVCFKTILNLLKEAVVVTILKKGNATYKYEFAYKYLITQQSTGSADFITPGNIGT